MRLIHQTAVYGVEVGPKTECIHWHSARDVIAIRFCCCNRFYSCIDCHQALEDHPPIAWLADQADQETVLCGACGALLTTREYLNSGSECPHCGAEFNPNCARHHNFYFTIEGAPPE